ncbi:hypothetical protein [Bacteroides sp.]|uniref:hypothetical protein n=1 Tax=Bacteroides sp. TaxID=29523 RepID=UPI00260A299F|nr:hypothetical protein [Bacteroides sp.]MDD3039082.1 hypothetical protein [Bacteroides sp.]
MKITAHELQKHFDIAEGDADYIQSFISTTWLPPTTVLKSIAPFIKNNYGVESLYPDYPDLVYLNMGDTYSPTIFHDGTSYQIGSWGDYVETHQKTFNITFKKTITVTATNQNKAIIQALTEMKDNPPTSKDIDRIDTTNHRKSNLKKTQCNV